MIRHLTASDWSSVKSIYVEGIRTNNATFETEDAIPGFHEWITHKINNSCFVFSQENEVLGWSALSPVSNRCVYQGVAEVSVYVGTKAQGKGIGNTLLNALISFSDKNNIWTLQAGILAENNASIMAHKKCGFREVGLREKIGQLHGEWRDVILMERRSTVIL